MKPQSKNATRLPPGIERPQIAVTSVRSLSVNHVLLKRLITLLTNGCAHEIIVCPKRITQNPYSGANILTHPPMSIITVAILRTTAEPIDLYMNMLIRVRGTYVAAKIYPHIFTSICGT